MTVMLPRFFLSVLISIFYCVLISLVLLGQPMNVQIRGCRRKALKIIYRLFAATLNGILMFTISHTKYLTMDDVDHYKEWLGPVGQNLVKSSDSEVNSPIDSTEEDSRMNSSTDNSSAENSPIKNSSSADGSPRIPKRGIGRPSTIVSNHLGYIDVIALTLSNLHPSFAPHGGLANVPLLGPACRGL